MKITGCATLILFVNKKIVSLLLLLLPFADMGSARAAADLPPSPSAVRAELVRTVIAGVRQPSDLDAAAEKITSLLGPSTPVTYRSSPFSTSGPPPPHDPQTALVRLAVLGRQITEGKIRTNFFGGMRAVERAASGFAPAETYAGLPALCRMLQFQAAATYLGPAAETPHDGESIEVYLDRVAAAAAGRGDWPLAWKALEFLGLGWRNLEWLVLHLDGIDLYLTGLGQEAAGRLTEAVVSYQRALLSTGQYVPTHPIGLRLTELKASSPESYVAGTDQALRLSGTQPTGSRGRGGAIPQASSPNPQWLLSVFSNYVSGQLGLQPANGLGAYGGRGATPPPNALLRRGDVVIDPMPDSSPAAFLQHIIPADLVAISRDSGMGAGAGMSTMYALPSSILPEPPFVPPPAPTHSAPARGP
jgi:hypothetical protein